MPIRRVVWVSLVAFAVGLSVATAWGGVLQTGWFTPALRWIQDLYLAYDTWWRTSFASSVVYFSPSLLVALLTMAVLLPRRVRDPETRCRKCGYILRALTKPECPECGETI